MFLRLKHGRDRVVNRGLRVIHSEETPLVLLDAKSRCGARYGGADEGRESSKNAYSASACACMYSLCLPWMGFQADVERWLTC